MKVIAKEWVDGIAWKGSSVGKTEISSVLFVHMFVYGLCDRSTNEKWDYVCLLLVNERLFEFKPYFVDNL